MHSLQKTVMASDIPVDLHPLKCAVKTYFSKLYHSGQLNLKLKKRNALTYFVACVPQMITKSATRDNILHGFLENGMLDHKCKWYPNFNSMLAMWRTNPTKDEYKLCTDKFPVLFQHQLKHGHVPDSNFELLGFPLDRDMSGTEVRRDATITQEVRQCTKILLTFTKLNSVRKEQQSYMQRNWNYWPRNKPIVHLWWVLKVVYSAGMWYLTLIWYGRCQVIVVFPKFNWHEAAGRIGTSFLIAGCLFKTLVARSSATHFSWAGHDNSDHAWCLSWWLRMCWQSIMTWRSVSDALVCSSRSYSDRLDLLGWGCLVWLASCIRVTNPSLSQYHSIIHWVGSTGVWYSKRHLIKSRLTNRL